MPLVTQYLTSDILYFTLFIGVCDHTGRYARAVADSAFTSSGRGRVTHLDRQMSAWHSSCQNQLPQHLHILMR